jgi:hypothetical protein
VSSLASLEEAFPDESFLQKDTEMQQRLRLCAALDTFTIPFFKASNGSSFSYYIGFENGLYCTSPAEAAHSLFVGE